MFGSQRDWRDFKTNLHFYLYNLTNVSLFQTLIYDKYENSINMKFPQIIKKKKKKIKYKTTTREATEKKNTRSDATRQQFYFCVKVSPHVGFIIRQCINNTPSLPFPSKKKFRFRETKISVMRNLTLFPPHILKVKTSIEKLKFPLHSLQNHQTKGTLEILMTYIYFSRAKKKTTYVFLKLRVNFKIIDVFHLEF